MEYSNTTGLSHIIEQEEEPEQPTRTRLVPGNTAHMCAPFNDHTCPSYGLSLSFLLDFFFLYHLLFQLTIQLPGMQKKKEKGNFSATVCRSYSIIHLADE